MKRLLFAVLILPLFGLAQDITNTLGTNGSFIIEDENNTNLIRATRQTGSDFLINIGDWASGVSLPTGNVNFLHENGSDRMNIVTAKGSASAAFPKLQLFYTPGSLSSPTEIGDDDVLGIINFGGYRTAGGWVIASSIKSVVNGTPAGGVPADLLFQTTDVGSNSYNMVFDNAGNLTVDGAITSQAIQAISVAPDYQCTINDQTIIATSNAGIIALPAVTTEQDGKVITIKVGSSSVTTIQVRDLTSAEIYDADENTVTNDEILLDADGQYVTLQYNHTNTTWYVISGNY